MFYFNYSKANFNYFGFLYNYRAFFIYKFPPGSNYTKATGNYTYVLT
jgi:hypothetical protein